MPTSPSFFDSSPSFLFSSSFPSFPPPFLSSFPFPFSTPFLPPRTNFLDVCFLSPPFLFTLIFSFSFFYLLPPPYLLPPSSFLLLSPGKGNFFRLKKEGELIVKYIDGLGK